MACRFASRVDPANYVVEVVNRIVDPACAEYLCGYFLGDFCMTLMMREISRIAKVTTGANERRYRAVDAYPPPRLTSRPRDLLAGKTVVCTPVENRRAVGLDLMNKGPAAITTGDERFVDQHRPMILVHLGIELTDQLRQRRIEANADAKLKSGYIPG